jgi:hypothetical protein
MILAEYTFITQELQFCDKSDKDSFSSLTKAIQSFDDDFLALQAVEEDGYKTAEKTYPHNGKYRVKSFPMDSFHIACIGHRTRIRNMLKTPGIDPIEKAPTNNSTVMSGVDEIRQHVVAQIYAAVWQKLRSRFSGFSGRLKQRFANLPVAQNGYVEKQKVALQMSN